MKAEQAAKSDTGGRRRIDQRRVKCGIWKIDDRTSVGIQWNPIGRAKLCGGRRDAGQARKIGGCAGKSEQASRQLVAYYSKCRMVCNHPADRDLVGAKKVTVLIGPAKRSRDARISERKWEDGKCGEIFYHLTERKYGGFELEFRSLKKFTNKNLSKGGYIPHVVGP